MMRHQRQGHDLVAMPAVLPQPAQRPGVLRQQVAAGGGQVGLLGRGIETKIASRDQMQRDAQRFLHVGLLLRVDARLRQDERRARLVDQNAVGLVHQCHPQPAQQQAGRLGLAAFEMAHAVVQLAGQVPPHQPVAQVVEGQLLGGAVGDVAAVRSAALGLVQRARHRAHGETQHAIDRAEVRRVAIHQIVVGGDHVHGHAGQRRGGGGDRGRQRLALAGGHLGQAVVEHDAGGDELGVKLLHAQRAAGGLAHQRERLGHRRVGEALGAQARADRTHARGERGSRERPHRAWNACLRASRKRCCRRWLTSGGQLPAGVARRGVVAVLAALRIGTQRRCAVGQGGRSHAGALGGG